MRRSCLLVVAILATNVFGGDEEILRSMQGMQGLSIQCDTAEKLSLVESYEGHRDFDFLSITKVLGDEIKILVTADAVNNFKTALSNHDIEYTIFVDDVAEVVREDHIRNEIARNKREKVERSPFNFFPRFSEIEAYLKDIATKYSNIVSLINIGTSYEGKPIYCLKISSGPGDKPAIMMDAGIHAREWIAPTTALYAIHQLVTNATNSGLYENLDWYIVPSLNPDGYEFSHTTDRNWRKTRSPNAGSSCYGTDPNRNFGFEWMGMGASSDPCSLVYAGKEPFSEKETASLRDFVLANKKSIKVYLTIHSYGQFMLHPWGYTTVPPENEQLLHTVGIAAADALASVYGTRYTVGSSTNLLGAGAGGSDDWVMGGAGVPLSYTVELPAGGITGFNPPPSRIEPVGIETFEALKVFSKYAISNYS